MQNSRDSSVWRTLAVAFGDGLAFGVGIALTRNAAHLAVTRSATPELRLIATGKLPAAGAPPGREATEAIEGRFTEIGGHIDRRLAELDSKIKMDLDGLNARVDGLRGEFTEAAGAQRRSSDAEIRALRVQMAALHKEFAGTLARLVDEQISTTVAARLQAVEEAVEERLRDTIREETRHKDQQIAELRRRIESQESNLLNLVLTLGQSCLQAAGRISPEETPPQPPSAPDPELPA